MKTLSKVEKSFITLFLVFSTLQYTNFSQADNQKPCSETNENTQPRLVIQTGHSDHVKSVAFSPDGKLIASTGIGKLIIWDVKSEREINSIHYGGFTGDNSLAFSPDGKTIASSGLGKLIIWDVRKGCEIQSFSYSNPDESNLTSVAFSPDGKLVAISHYSISVDTLIWDIESGKMLYSYENQTTSIDFSQDGRFLLGGGRDNYLRIWDTTTGNEVKSILTNHSTETFSGITSVVFNPDNDGVVASGGWDGLIRLWDINTSTKIRTFKGHSGLITSVAFSADGKFLASGSWDHTVRLWDVVTGNLIHIFEGHSYHVNSVAFSPDGLTIASGSGDNLVKFWNIAMFQPISFFLDKQLNVSPVNSSTLTGRPSAVNTVKFSPNNHYIASGHENNLINIWDLETGKRIHTFSGHSAPVTSISFNPANDKILASGSKDTTIKLWNLPSKQEIKTLSEHNSDVSSISFSSTGDVLVSGSFDASTKIWRAESGKNILSFNEEFDSRKIHTVTYSPNGKMVAVGTVYGTVKLIDAATGNVLFSRRGHSDRVQSIIFSTDGSILASSGWDGMINLWDVTTGQELRSYRAHTIWGSESIVFSPDMKLIASAGGDHIINLIDVVTGKKFRSLNGHTDRVTSVDFSFDGNTLISGSADGTIKIWKTKTGELLATLVSFDKNDWAVLTPEGRFDSNNLDENRDLHWIMPDAPLKPIPVEVFLREYYEPRLLPRTLADEFFIPIRPLLDLNRVQPDVKITKIESEIDYTDRVKVTVELNNVKEIFPRANNEIMFESGVYDLRLFRNGQIVGQDPKPEQLKNFSARNNELSKWREDSKIDLENNKKTSIQFRNISLPRNVDIKEVEFTAYAFNEDRVKSSTSKRIFKLPKSLIPRNGKAYLITMGVNTYENPSWNLSFAANDARVIQQTLSQELGALGEYQEIIQIPLISDSKLADEKIDPLLNNATKENLKSVLFSLSGVSVDHEKTQGIPNLEKVISANPEDLIIISFSGHGYVDSDGIFYLLPHDIGQGKDKSITDILLQNSISTDELAFWLRDVDASNIALIIDACHSAALVESEGFKPGPMSSRGLGQLAYDKGIKILTASQADDFALEVGQLKHGLLTYTLIKEGIEKNKADNAPTDKSIMLNEWLNYGVNQVPVLHEKIKTGELRGLDIFIPDESEPTKRKFQQPALFDFSRRNKDIVLTLEE